MSASTIPQTTSNNNKNTVARTTPNWQRLLWWASIIALLAIAIGMRFYALGVPFDRDGYDEGVYWQSLRSMSMGHTLYQQIFYSQPPFFLLSTFPIFALFGGTLWSARLSIALVSLVGFGGAFCLGKVLSGRWGGWGAIAAMLLLVVAPLYLSLSQTLDAEASSTAFALLAVGVAYLWWDHPTGVKGLLLATLCGVALALSIMCKLLAVTAALPVGLLILTRLWLLWNRRQNGDTVANNASNANSGGLRSAIVLIAASIVVMVILVLPFVGSLHNLLHTVITFHADAKNTFSYQQSQNKTILKDFFTANIPLFIVAAYGSIVALLRRDWRCIPLFAWFIVTLFLLWLQVPLFPRHCIILIPPLIGLAVMGLAPLANFEGSFARFEKFAKFVPLLALAGILVTTGVNLQQDATYYHTEVVSGSDSTAQLDAHVASDLRNSITPAQLVVTDSQFIAGLADRTTPPSLVDTSTVRIDTGYITLRQLENEASQPQVHAVLFFSGRFTLPPVAGFHNWVAQHFHLKYNYGTGKELWVKP